MLANYHTHTRWCKHGAGEIEDYADTAIAYGYEELAITEHVPLHNAVDLYRLQPDEFPAFNRALDQAIADYADRLRILKGFECEYFPDEMDFYRRYRDDYGYHVLVLGQHKSGKNRMYDHFDSKDADAVHSYADEVCEGLETGFFTFLAHPDLVLECYEPGWDVHTQKAMDQIYRVCEAHSIPIEINANGLFKHRSYPSREALLYSKLFNLTYIINSDAHDPKFLGGAPIVQAEAFADSLGLSVTQKLLLDR